MKPIGFTVIRLSILAMGPPWFKIVDNFPVKSCRCQTNFPLGYTKQGDAWDIGDHPILMRQSLETDATYTNEGSFTTPWGWKNSSSSSDLSDTFPNVRWLHLHEFSPREPRSAGRTWIPSYVKASCPSKALWTCSALVDEDPGLHWISRQGCNHWEQVMSKNRDLIGERRW
jgi:hypothetical protein